MGVGIVHRLAARLGEHHQAERERRRPMRGPGPHPGQRRRVAHREQIGAVQRQREQHEHQQQQPLDEHGEHQIPRGAHQTERAGRIPRGERHREARQRQQADQHERVVAQPPIPGRARRSAAAAAPARARGRDRRRQRVDERVRLGSHPALAPQPAKLAVGLDDRGPAPALQARLQCWISPTIAGASSTPPTTCTAPAMSVVEAHPRTPIRASANSTPSSASR